MLKILENLYLKFILFNFQENDDFSNFLLYNYLNFMIIIFSYSFLYKKLKLNKIKKIDFYFTCIYKKLFSKKKFK